MNAAAEKLIDFIFYSAIIILALAAVGVDVVVLFASMATIIISFSFCVGGASSDVIKGLLFILLQRPYDIGELCIAE
jgi:small-conductance mechanosensitive channel